MKCDAAVERLLEADPAELRGRSETELARHVAGCDRCGRIAATLTAELGAVDEALGAYAAAGDAGADADRAMAAAGRPRRLSRFARIGVPLAAAAVLATMLLVRPDGRPGGIPDPGPTPGETPRVAVTPPPDAGVAVMETENPKITIVWLYEREES